MFIEPEEWWRGDRFKALVFMRARQLIFEFKDRAYQHAPRRKTNITVDVAEAIATAVAIGWRDDDPEQWKTAGGLLRAIADGMERDGLRSLSWGPQSTFDANPETFVGIISRDGGYFEVTFPDLPEVFVWGRPGDDEGELTVQALDEAVLARLIGGKEIPALRYAESGEVDVALSPVVGNKLRGFRVYGHRPKS